MVLCHAAFTLVRGMVVVVTHTHPDTFLGLSPVEHSGTDFLVDMQGVVLYCVSFTLVGVHWWGDMVVVVNTVYIV